MRNFFRKWGTPIATVLSAAVVVFFGIYYFVQPEGWGSQEPTALSLIAFILAALTLVLNVATWIMKKKIENRNNENEK